MTESIMVRFAGDGEGVGQLTWAQRNIWRMMQMLGTPEMVGGAMPLEEGTTVEHIVHLLSFIMSPLQLEDRYILCWAALIESWTWCMRTLFQ